MVTEPISGTSLIQTNSVMLDSTAGRPQALTVTMQRADGTQFPTTLGGSFQNNGREFVVSQIEMEGQPPRTLATNEQFTLSATANGGISTIRLDGASQAAAANATAINTAMTRLESTPPQPQPNPVVVASAVIPPRPDPVIPPVVPQPAPLQTAPAAPPQAQPAPAPAAPTAGARPPVTELNGARILSAPLNTNDAIRTMAASADQRVRTLGQRLAANSTLNPANATARYVLVEQNGSVALVSGQQNGANFTPENIFSMNGNSVTSSNVPANSPAFAAAPGRNTPAVAGGRTNAPPGPSQEQGSNPLGNNMFGIILAIIGAIAGFMMGGVPGALAGLALGGAGGSLLGDRQNGVMGGVANSMGLGQPQARGNGRGHQPPQRTTPPPRTTGGPRPTETQVATAGGGGTVIADTPPQEASAAAPVPRNPNAALGTVANPLAVAGGQRAVVARPTENNPNGDVVIRIYSDTDFTTNYRAEPTRTVRVNSSQLAAGGGVGLSADNFTRPDGRTITGGTVTIDAATQGIPVNVSNPNGVNVRTRGAGSTQVSVNGTLTPQAMEQARAAVGSNPASGTGRNAGPDGVPPESGPVVMGSTAPAPNAGGLQVR